MDLTILPQKLSGSVTVPPSKSLAHRAVICAALSDGSCKIDNIALSDDIIATTEAMKTFGATIEQDGSTLTIHGAGRNVKRTGDAASSEERVIDCNESGSTLRFIVPIATLFAGVSRFVGRGNLGKRPLTIYYDIFEEQGISYQATEDELNLTVDGMLKPGHFSFPGNVSSQFITGLLFTLPLLAGDSVITITTPLESVGYIDLTLQVMKDFGVDIENQGNQKFIIKGNQSYHATDYRIEGDYSQAAFFLCADALGNAVQVEDLSKDSLQGDRAVVSILEAMGVTFQQVDTGMIGTANEGLHGTLIDAAQCPDIIPVVALTACLSEGRTEIINAGRLRIKECDRLEATASQLKKLGADIQELPEGLLINGIKSLKGGERVWSFKDHRIAMMLAIAATVCEEPITVTDAECVSKSYPNFWEDYQSIGGKIQ
ncbi:epsp synthase signature 2 [Trichococcus palustris]|uniref:3-phosphoshikimate 1-carboxyvinyltransferase n=1 Tax=Trichococcus palustris TaxID=140314 RepID=A0A143Y6N0_9LACT|nr:3-phosphoshikimate 1-carboxyvinyltransferase [Trichococcus palustris]CZQ81109.1 epsp synthase signature 2 [Trichococcus palustris]SFK63253.1 3-phosphoshikimate 1-carboxyvinyltransferase [Trichococcus palustris]